MKKHLFALMGLSLFLIYSCSPYKQVACPDFKSRENNSKKFQLLYANGNIFNLFDDVGKSKIISHKKRSFDLNVPTQKEFVPITDGHDFGTLDNKKACFAFQDLNEFENANKSVKAPNLNAFYQNQPVLATDIDSTQTHTATDSAYSKVENPTAPHKKASGFAIASFVSAALGLFLFPLPLWILAFIFGGIALKRIRANPQKGKGWAIAGIVIGILEFLGTLLLLYIFYMMVTSISSY